MRAPRTTRAGPASIALGGALLGAVLLVVAEFTPLAHIYSSARGSPVVETIMTGSHHAYALIPIAVLAPALALSVRVTGNRLALAAIGALGLVVLGIALLGDLPDAHASGLIGHAGAAYVSAAAQPGIGLYLETLAAVVLLLTGAAGLLLGAERSTAISSPG
ncbi:MAG TPA: hypothetical protein VIK04_11155 [Solirubrobacteraceae bacterium]